MSKSGASTIKPVISNACVCQMPDCEVLYLITPSIAGPKTAINTRAIAQMIAVTLMTYHGIRKSSSVVLPLVVCRIKVGFKYA